MDTDFMKVADEGKEIFRITMEGKVILGKDVTLDEASKRFWEVIQEMAIKDAGHFITKERLLAGVKNVISNCARETISDLKKLYYLRGLFVGIFEELGIPISEENL